MTPNIWVPMLSNIHLEREYRIE